jgi:hypothetical protein
MKCTVCQHNQIKEIDRALLTGATLTSLNQKFGLSTSALHRHKDHLHKKMSRAEAGLEVSLRQGFFFKLNTILDQAMQTALTASTEGNSRLFLRAGSLASRLINQMHKLDFALEPEMIYCLLASPTWNMTDSLLPGAFQALSDTRQTLATDLLAPCADLDPEPASDLAQTSPDETEISDLETLVQTADLDDRSRDLLRKIFPSLVPEPIQSTTENHPFKKWEITGKLPGKSPCLEDNNQEYQEDILCEKNAGKSSASPPSAAQPEAPETEDGKPEYQWEETEKIPQYSRNSEEIWQEHQKFLREIEEEEIARHARTESTGIPPANPDPATNSSRETPNSQPENPIDRPQYIPDRRWEADFGNPRKFKGCY